MGKKEKPEGYEDRAQEKNELCGIVLLFLLQEEQGAGLPFGKKSHNLISWAEESTTISPQGVYTGYSDFEQPLGNVITSLYSFLIRASVPNLYKEHISVVDRNGRCSCTGLCYLSAAFVLESLKSGSILLLVEI